MQECFINDPCKKFDHPCILLQCDTNHPLIILLMKHALDLSYFCMGREKLFTITCYMSVNWNSLIIHNIMTYKTHLGKNNGKYSMRSTTDIIHVCGGCCSDGIKQFCQCLHKIQYRNNCI